MKNILSIDFDIVMAPDINLYNALVGGEFNKTIDDLIEHHNFLENVRMDYEHYNKLFLLLLDLVKYLNPEDVRISYNHEDIKYMLQNDMDLVVYNIDHHHDLNYKEEDDLIKCPICSCANWAKYFLENGNISRYIWIKNSNSIPKKDLYKFTWGEKIETRDLIKIDSLVTSLPKIDKLFICLSPEWVPKKYHSLFYLMIDYLNKELNTHFTIY